MMFGDVGVDSLIVVALLFAVVAFFYSNLGLGGGQLYVPIMVLFFSPILFMKDIVPLSLSCAFVTMLTSTYSHSKKGLVDFKLGAYLALAGLVGVVVGVIFTINAADTLVKASFTVLLIVVATKMMYDLYKAKKDATTCPTEHDRRTMVAGLGVSLLTGMLVGSFGIGGGVVSVPLIIYVFKFEPRKAIGTSAMMGSILTPAAFLAYALDQSINSTLSIHYDLIIVLVPIVFVFAYIGSMWGLEKLRTRVVKTIFTAGVYLAAAGMIYSLLFT
jgi:uncharacterized membrane protein YfcA